MINDVIELIYPDGKVFKILNKRDYYAYRNVIVDGLKQSIYDIYQDIKEHHVLSEKIRFKFKPFKNTDISIMVETDLNPELLFIGNEIQVNTKLYERYPRLQEIIAQTTTVATKFKDYDNYYNFLQMPEYYTLFLLAGTDNELTDKIIKAQLETTDYYAKTSLTPQQLAERRDAIKLLLDLRAESMKPPNLRRNLRAEDYLSIRTIRKKGITGEILPCWGLE
ncbi:MAG: hypothetical protein GPW19_04110 [Euryarchaeota archaeon]|nr:hypothetical protein [Euryarchaeota archaeon]